MTAYEQLEKDFAPRSLAVELTKTIVLDLGVRELFEILFGVKG